MNRVMTGILFMVVSMGMGLGQDSGTDPLQNQLFSVESIMRNQRELQLDEAQRSYMVKQIQETQSEFTSLQWQLQDEVGRLSGLLENAEAPERDVLRQLDKVLDLEKAIKRSHLRLAVRMKNRLTQDQRMKLREFRDANRAQRLNRDRVQRRQVRPGVQDSGRQRRPRTQDSRPRTRPRTQDSPRSSGTHQRR